MSFPIEICVLLTTMTFPRRLVRKRGQLWTVAMEGLSYKFRVYMFTFRYDIYIYIRRYSIYMLTVSHYNIIYIYREREREREIEREIERERERERDYTYILPSYQLSHI